MVTLPAAHAKAAELLAAYAARERSPVEVVAELSAAVEADPHGAFWATCLERARDVERRVDVEAVDVRVLGADLVPGEQIEYAGLDRAFLAPCRLRQWRVVLWNQWLDAKVYPKPPETASSNGEATRRAAAADAI